jgi:hypothetical protein
MSNPDTTAENEVHCNIHYDPEHRMIYTEGLSELELPELEIRHVANFFATAARDILAEVGDFMFCTGTPVHAGETMNTVHNLMPETRFRFKVPEPVPGLEALYRVERLQIVELNPACDCCRFAEEA